jgi:hypothetical protein
MRKQDRIASDKQNRSGETDQDRMQPSQPEREQMKGRASESEAPSRPPRQSGKLPLPD